MPIFRKIWKGVKRLFGKKKAVKPKYKSRFAKRRSVRQTGVLTVKKTVIGTRQDIKSNSLVPFVDTFELADFPQYVNYINLYEEFRIDKVVYKLVSMNNQAPNFVNTGTVTTGLIHSCVDTNDANAPASIQSLMNDPTYRCTRSTKVAHTRVIYPKYLTEVQSNSVSKPTRGWMTCINQQNVVNAVSHYGIKGFYEGGVNTAGNYTGFYIEPQITYFISFRNPQ